MSNRKGLTISKVRTGLYKTARILGDISAVKNGTIGKRLLRRAAGRATNGLLGRLFR